MVLHPSSNLLSLNHCLLLCQQLTILSVKTGNSSLSFTLPIHHPLPFTLWMSVVRMAQGVHIFDCGTHPFFVVWYIRACTSMCILCHSAL